MKSVSKILAICICIAAVSADFNIGSSLNGLRQGARDAAEAAVQKGREAFSHFRDNHADTTPAQNTPIDQTSSAASETTEDAPVPLVLPVDIAEETSTTTTTTPEPQPEPQCVEMQLGAMTYWWTPSDQVSWMGNTCDGLTHGETPANHTRACVRNPHEISGFLSVFVRPVADAPASSLTGCQMVVSQRNLTDKELSSDPCGTSPSDSFCVRAQVSPTGNMDIMFTVPASHLLAWEEKFLSCTCKVQWIGAGLFTEPAKEIGESTQPAVIGAGVKAIQYGAPKTVAYFFQSTKGNTMNEGIDPTAVRVTSPSENEFAVVDEDNTQEGEASFTLFVQEAAGTNPQDVVVEMRVMNAKPCESFSEKIFNGMMRWLGLGADLEQNMCPASPGDPCTLDLPALGSFIVGLKNVGKGDASIKVFSGKVAMEHLERDQDAAQALSDFLDGLFSDSSEAAAVDEPASEGELDVAEPEQQVEEEGVAPVVEDMQPMMLDVDRPVHSHPHHKHTGIHHRHGMALWKWGAIAGAVALSMLIGALAFHCVRKRRLEQQLSDEAQEVRTSYVQFASGLHSDYQPL